MTRTEESLPQIVYWRNRTADCDSTCVSLVEKKLQGKLNVVENPDQFKNALTHPRTQLIITHNGDAAENVVQEVKTCCPDAVLVLICDDETKISPAAREKITHLLNTRNLDQLGALLQRELVRTNRLWSLKGAQSSLTRCVDVMNFVPDAVVVQDLDGTVSIWNSAAETLFGWTEKEALGKSHADLLKVVTEAKGAEIDLALKSGGLGSGELVYRGKNGHEARVLCRRKWARSDDGTITGIVEVSSDVSALQRIERKSSLLNDLQVLFQTVAPIEARLEQFARHVVPLQADACIIDLQDEEELIRRVVFCSDEPSLEAIAPAIKAELPIFAGDRVTAGNALRGERPEITAPVNDLAEFLGIDDQGQRAKLNKIKVHSALTAPIVYLGSVSGVMTFLSLDPKRTFDDNDKQSVRQFAAMIGAAIESSRLEQRLHVQSSKLQASSVNKDAFLGMLSHELRTPLQAMLGWSQLLREKHLTHEITEKALDALELSIKAQSKIVNDLLDLSRINSGKLYLSVRPVKLKPLLEQTLGAFEVSAGVKQIDLTLLPLEDPDIWIRTDAVWLQRAFWNILSNAVKFTPIGGQITVELSHQNDFAVIRFSDTGVGIEQQFLPKVFDYFSQADSGTTRSHEGLGVGMVISRFVVEAHGGTIDVASAGKNKGALFTVKIPVCAPAVQPVEVEPPPPEPDTNTEVSLNGVRILLVEDEQDTRDLLRFIFEQAGAQVVEAPLAKSALAALHASSFDVMVSDIGLPHEDGYALIRKVRQLPSEMGGRIPAVALTAYASKEDRMQALRAGFQAHAAKPVDIGELLLLVRSIVDKP